MAATTTTAEIQRSCRGGDPEPDRRYRLCCRELELERECDWSLIRLRLRIRLFSVIDSKSNGEPFGNGKQSDPEKFWSKLYYQ
eukprot:jgi/Psemu1/8499/gm1.8499_g